MNEFDPDFSTESAEPTEILVPANITMFNRSRLGNLLNDPEYFERRTNLFTQTAVLANQGIEPIYLTNGCCEHTMVPESVFDAMKLAKGDDGGKFYPLTSAEQAFIGEDSTSVTSGGTARLAFAMLYQGKKWIVPHVEYVFGGNGERTPEQAFSELCQGYLHMLSRVEGIGGKVIVSLFDGEAHGVNPGEYGHSLLVFLPIPFLLDLYPSELYPDARVVFAEYKTWVAAFLSG